MARVTAMEVKVTATFMGLLLPGQINQFLPWPDCFQMGVNFGQQYLSGWDFAIQSWSSPAQWINPYLNSPESFYLIALAVAGHFASPLVHCSYFPEQEFPVQHHLHYIN